MSDFGEALDRAKVLDPPTRMTVADLSRVTRLAEHSLRSWTDWARKAAIIEASGLKPPGTSYELSADVIGAHDTILALLCGRKVLP